MIFFTADTHFFHENIIKFCNRPFPDMLSMNQQLIDNWNSVVTKQDEIYVVGDFIWPKHVAAQEVDKVLKRLNGDIHLIPGDHDMTQILNHIRPGKVVIHDKVHILTGLKDIEQIVMCHWPMRNWPASHYNSIHLFGHVHNGPKPDPLYAYGRSFNVGVDVWDFKPISLTQILEKVKVLGDNPNFIKKRK
jgi:calcineurin-like phosphoesterase family protein